MPGKLKIDNPELIPLALHSLEGAGKFVDVEDIFQECWKIAPERFGWRKYEYPNYKTLSKALRDFEGNYPNLLLKTKDGLMRQLSAEGVRWIEGRLPLYNKLLERREAMPPTRMRTQRLLNEVRDHKLFTMYSRGDRDRYPKHEVADLLTCSPDSPVSTWNQRIGTLRSAAAVSKRSDLAEFFDFLLETHSEWFREGQT